MEIYIETIEKVGLKGGVVISRSGISYLIAHDRRYSYNVISLDRMTTFARTVKSFEDIEEVINEKIRVFIPHEELKIIRK